MFHILFAACNCNVFSTVSHLIGCRFVTMVEYKTSGHSNHHSIRLTICIMCSNWKGKKAPLFQLDIPKTV